VSKQNNVSEQETFPTTKIQHAYFVGRQPELPLGGVECVACLTFSGKAIDEHKLRAALEKVATHPALRWRFLDADQLLLDEVSIPELKIHHLHRSQEGGHESAVREQMLSQSVDLTSGHLWDIALTHWHDGGTTMHIAISLAVVDLPGLSALMHYLAQSYCGEKLPPQWASATHFYQQLSEHHARVADKRQRSHDKLAKLGQGRSEKLFPPPDLPFTHFRAADGPQSEQVERRSRFYDIRQWSKLQEYASGLGVTSAALVLALYTRALRLCSATPDFIVTVTNVPMMGSEILLAERTVAYAHRSRMAESLDKLAQDTQDDLHYRLLRGIDSEDELRSALADVAQPHPGISPYVFTYAAQQPVFSPLAIDTFGEPRIWTKTPQTVIDCQVLQLDEQQIEVAFDVRRAAILADVDSAVFDMLTESIDDVIAGRSMENSLPRASRAYRTRTNSTAAASSPAMLFSGFRKQVKKRPQAIALVAFPADPKLAPELIDPLTGGLREQQRWSYTALDQLALRLAARLVRHAQAGDIIGIRLPKGPSQIVAVLAVMYAGCTYLPVGLDIPTDRLAKIRQRSGMRYLLTTKDFDQLEQQKPLTQLRLPEGGCSSEGSPDALAYIIFTSGSTGEPKGVAVSHRAANNTVVDVNTRHEVTENDVFLAVSSLDFDLSVYDIFGPLSCGGCIVTLNEYERRDAFRWAELIGSQQVTLWNSVPALAEMLVAAAGHLPSVRAWLCSGDWIPPSLFEQLKALSPDSILVAMGGSTEAAIWSNEYVIRQPEDFKTCWPSVPYGLPLSGQQYRVVREDDAGLFVDCPDCVVGELWIGGEGLAQGYLGDPQLTAERFVYAKENPYADPTRWYRTGDLGYWREGLLFFIGRQDTQVKIHGYRVDCGEVEQILKRVPGIDNAVVVPVRKGRALSAVLLSDKHSLNLDQLHQLLSRQLPHYMIPTRLLIRQAFPLNRNGKIDRYWAARELEADESAAPTDTEKKRSAVFATCQKIWCQVLKRDSVCAADNFFALGGDSLAATRVCALLQTNGIEVAVNALFTTNTLEMFARRCQPCSVQKLCKTPDEEERQSQPFPLTSLQRAYALGADGIPGVNRCDTVFAVIIRSPEVHPLRHWQRALDELIAETAALRLVRTEAQQQVVSAKPVSVLTLPQQQNLADFLAETSLDARQHPPIQLVSVEGQPTRIGLMFNYLGLDALSLMRITLALIERVIYAKQDLQLESSILPFAHYASTHDKLEPACPTWQSDNWVPPRLPSTALRSAISRIRSQAYHLNSRLRRLLEERARKECVTVSALILKAYSEAILLLCERPQVVFVVPVCWRPVESPQALGQFTQLRLCRCARNDSLADISRALNDAVAGKTPDDRYIAAQGRAAYPFVFTSTTGIPEVVPLYQGEKYIEWTHTRTPGVLIDCQVLPDGDGLEIRWDYASEQLEHSLLTAAYTHFVSQLAALAGDTEEKEGLSADALVAALSGHQIAERAIAAALPMITSVPDILAPVVAAWRRWTTGDTDSAWQAAGQFLSACVNGEKPRSELLRHPTLAPERLLLASLRHVKFFDSLIAELHTDYARLEARETGLRVLIMGAGSGAFSQSLVQASAEKGLPLIVDEYENNDALNSLAQRRELPEAEWLADVIIVPATLHREYNLLTRLTKVRTTQTGSTPVRLYILEVTEPDAASLIAAVLDPTLVDSGQSPLLTGSEWGQRLEEHGVVLEQMQRPVENLVWIKARLTLGHADLQLAKPALERAGVKNEVACCWERVLELTSPVAPTADFFALGGDSLRATQIVMALRQQGYSSILLADLFNYPTFEAFVERVLSQHVTTPTQLIHPGKDTAEYPLTPLQKAYLIGRSPEQLLGGVAPHCYFEFSVPHPEGIDTERFQQAINQVVARHDALRSLVFWQDGAPFGRVSAQVNLLLSNTDNVRSLTETETPDPEQDPPLRVRISPDGKIIGIGMDNLMLDGTSMFLVMHELGAIYRGKSISPPSPITYAQYRTLRCEAPDIPDVKAMPPAPRLPYLVALDSVSNMRFARCACDIDGSEWHAIRQQASQWQITPAALLLAAYALEVAGLADESAFSLNVTTFERDPDIPGVATMVGDFTHLGLVAFDTEPGSMDPQQCRQQLSALARAAHRGILAIHETPEKVNTLSVAREAVRRQGDPLAGLFPVVFTSGLGLGPGAFRSDDFGFGTLTWARSQTPQVTMDFQVHDDVRGLHITVDYVTALLSHESVDTLTSGVARRLRELINIIDPSHAELTGMPAKIAQIWLKYLPPESALPLDNFFQSGGDSLHATRCIRELQKEVDPGISLRLLLLYPRFDDFCAQVALLVSRRQRQVSPAPATDTEEGML